MARLADLDHILVCNHIVMVSPVRQKEANQEFFFEVHTTSRADPFVFVSPSKTQCTVNRQKLINQLELL